MTTEVDTIVGNDADTDLDILEEHFAEELRLTHIVTPSDNKTICYVLGNGPELTAVDIVDYARIHRIFVIAVCGYKFIPKHNPEKYDTCNGCLDEAHRRLENGE